MMVSSRRVTCRDLHPGDYVFVKQFYQEDYAEDIDDFIVKVWSVTPTYISVKEGSGFTKYSYYMLRLIELTNENIERFDLFLLSDPKDDYHLWGKGLVAIDPMEAESGGCDPMEAASRGCDPRVYFNDGDGKDVMYMSEVQQYVYEKSGGTYEPDINPNIKILVDMNMNFNYKHDDASLKWIRRAKEQVEANNVNEAS
jgi:hypothetical protein